MRFEVLGPTRVVAVAAAGAVSRQPDAPLSLGGPKQRLVLALLLANANSVVSIDRLVDGLWGDDPPESARHTVQSYVSELRKLLGPVIERVGTGYRLQVDRHHLDSLEFEALISEGLTTVPTNPDGGADALEAALALWRGVPFDDLVMQPSLQAESARLGELRLAAIEGLMEARLAAGRHAEVVVELDRLTRAHPYREELRALHMIALYRSGRQAEALRAYRATRDVLGDDLGILPSPRLRRLEEQILLQDPDLDAPLAPSSPGRGDRWVENPYLGLRAFREADHARFFGQEQLVDRLVARAVGASGFTALVGPSGSGKSSAVQAGLIPRLRRDHSDVAIALMQPGVHPLGSLEAALGEISRAPSEEVTRAVERSDGLAARARALLDEDRRRLVLVVDQFEELFTMVDEVEARTFLDLITQGVRDGGDAIHVVVTLRADFYDRPLAEPTFGQLFADNVVSVVALGPEQLESAATLPARQLDIEVEPRLVGRLVADVAGQPNALPLFQYALTELFDARSGGLLDLATYERIGGVRKAVARRAESLYAQLDATEQEAARQLFLRIATVSDDIVGRRRVPASELVSLDLDLVALGNVIDAFARYRLLALDRDPASGSPTVEVAHEALLSEWHRLRDWIDEHRDDLFKQASFIAAVNEWETSGRDPGYLLHGKRLDTYESWAAGTQLRMTATEQDFLTAAVAARDADAADEARREQHRLRLQRRSRRQLVGLFVAAAVLAAVIAYPILTRPGDPERVVVVLEAGRANSAFDELFARSVEQAGDDLGFDVEMTQPPYADVGAELRASVDGASIVIGSIGMNAPLLDLADEFPDAVVVLADSSDAPLPNTVGVSFAHEEGSFLVGAAAALETATGKVGYIGANASPLIDEFRAGFEQGVAAVDPDVEVVSEVLYPTVDPIGYLDAPVAHETATGMFADGVDVIFVAAGLSGMGVIEAATELSTSERRLWAIGVDTDQYFDVSVDQREHLLTSMFKSAEVGVRSVLEAKSAGTLVVPGVVEVGVADGAVGYTDSGGHLDDATVARLEAFRAQIADGEIVVDPVPSETLAVDANTTLFRLELDTGDTTPLDVGSGRIDDFDVSPDGTRLAGGHCCFTGDRITILDLEGGDEAVGVSAPVPSPGRSHYGAAWSPDGSRLVVQDRVAARAQVGRIVVADVETGSLTTIVDLDASPSWWWWLAPTFGSDGRDIVFHRPREEGETSPFDIWTVPATGGEPELLVDDAAFPVPLGDGALAVVSGMRGLFSQQTPTIAIVDAGGAIRELTTAESWVWQPRLSPDRTRLAYVEGDPASEAPRARVLDLTTGESTIVGRGEVLDWLDDDTIIVGSFGS